MKRFFVLLFLLCLMSLAGNDFIGSAEWGSTLENEDDYILVESSLDLRIGLFDDWKASCYLEVVPPEEELHSSEFDSGSSLDFPVFKGGIISLGGAYALVESADFPSPKQDRTRTELSLDKRAAFKDRMGAALFTPDRNLILHGLQDSIHSETGFLWLPAGFHLFGKTGMVFSSERTIKEKDDSWYNPEKEDIQEDILIIMGGLGYETRDINFFQITGDLTYSLPRYSLPGFQTYLQSRWSGEITQFILSSSYSSLYWQSAKGKLTRWRYGGSGVFDLSFGSSVNWKNKAVLFMPNTDGGQEKSYLNYEFESCLDTSLFSITMGWDKKKGENNYSGDITLFYRFGHISLMGEEWWNYKRKNSNNPGYFDQKVLLQICGEWEPLSFLLKGKLEYPLEEYWEKGEYNFEGEIIFSPERVWEIGWSTNYFFRPRQAGSEYFIKMRFSRNWE